MKVGDLVQFKGDLYLVMGCEPPPHDHNDVYKIQNITKLGSKDFEHVFKREVVVVQ